MELETGKSVGLSLSHQALPVLNKLVDAHSSEKAEVHLNLEEEATR